MIEKFLFGQGEKITDEIRHILPLPIPIGGNLKFNSKTNQLAIYLTKWSIKNKDRKVVKEGRIEFRLYESRGMMIPLVMFDDGYHNVFTELPFDPTDYGSEENFSGIGTELYIIFANIHTMIVEVVRKIELGPNFRKILISKWNEMNQGELKELLVIEFVHSAYKKKLSELWEEAKVIDWEQ
ncbi:hypothetical protein bcgnr5378_63780 [Bacillus cereus]